MRAEEKELEGQELEREERTHQGTEAAHEQEELPVLGGEVLRDVELAHRSTLFDAMRLVLAGEHVNVSLLYLPQRETHALEALQAAVTGRDSVGEFVFAEDRRPLLEQALAVLQQNVTYGDAEQLAELHGKFEELTSRVGALRDRLTSLEDAQEELLGNDKVVEAAKEGEDDEKPKPGTATPGDRAGPEKQQAEDRARSNNDASLTGPERPEAAKPPSSVLGAGPEAPPLARGPSTLVGEAVPEKQEQPTSLVGEAVPEEQAPPSSLYGEAPPEPEQKPSELAAEGEAAEAAKPPWWRRPFG